LGKQSFCAKQDRNNADKTDTGNSCFQWGWIWVAKYSTALLNTIVAMDFFEKEIHSKFIHLYYLLSTGIFTGLPLVILRIILPDEVIQVVKVLGLPV
jgi:hypothetical protein